MSTEMLDPVYGHHSPEHLKQAADAITGKRAANVSVVVSVVGKNFSSGKQQKDLQILGGACSTLRTGLYTKSPIKPGNIVICPDFIGT